MGNKAEIKQKLDALYEDYKSNKSQLNSAKTNEAAKLLIDMTFVKDAASSDVAVELARFSADITNLYFKSLTGSRNIPVERLDDVLNAFLATDNDKSKSQYYVQKFVFTVVSIMNTIKERAFQSEYLPKLVGFVARFAVRADKFSGKFQTLANNTAGGIYRLDYSKVDRRSLLDIQNATKAVFPDLSKLKFGEHITNWAEKYGLTLRLNNLPSSETPIPQITTPAAALDLPEKTGEAPNELYLKPKSVPDNEKIDIISALEKNISPIKGMISALQAQTDKNRELLTEISRSITQNAELQQQVSELKKRVQDAENALSVIRAEKDELDQKLKDAYSINSREASLEAQKLRSELTKSLSFLYEDWLEYEFSEVGEENYESLQAIIKKIFRALERNGIDFKGDSK